VARRQTLVGSFVAWRVGKVTEARLEERRQAETLERQQEEAARVAQAQQDAARREREALRLTEEARLAQEATDREAAEMTRLTEAQRRAENERRALLHRQVTNWCPGQVAALGRYANTARQFVRNLELSGYARRQECSVLAEATKLFVREKLGTVTEFRLRILGFR
jgi:hypothetical protein